WKLHNFARRANARRTRPAAVKDRVDFAFMVGEIFDLGLVLRLVRRLCCRWQHTMDRSGVSVTRTLIDCLERQLPVHFFLQDCRRPVDRIGPYTAQVGMSGACLLRLREAWEKRRTRE